MNHVKEIEKCIEHLEDVESYLLKIHMKAELSSEIISSWENLHSFFMDLYKSYFKEVRR